MAESSLLRVLLVEDLPSQRQLGRWALEAAGLEVVTAADGLTGLELAWSARPDVILLDLVLPGISGLELLRRYRQDRGTTPVLVLTGAGDPRVANLALARGASFILLKPVAWEEVIRQIRFFAGGLTLACRDLLEQMGAPVKWAGFHQAARCAGLLGQGQGMLLKEAYLQVAGEEHTSWGNVAKNIERLIRRLHSEGSPAYRALTAGLEGNRPTNADFLLILARAATIPL